MFSFSNSFPLNTLISLIFPYPTFKSLNITSSMYYGVAIDALVFDKFLVIIVAYAAICQKVLSLSIESYPST
jgi:hypothetical protein